MPQIRKPSYVLHKPTGQARVRIGGRDKYLGEYGSHKSKAAYEATVGEWLAGQDPKRATLTIEELALEFMVFADKNYRHRDGSSTCEARNLRDALRPVVRLFGSTLIRDFGPKPLKAVRDEMIRAGACRTNINRQVHRIRRVFAWRVENELVPPTIYQGLKAVAALRKGRSDARESVPVKPVDDAIVDQTLPYLTSVLQAIVRIQLLTGARPGEICMLRPCDITMRTDGIWAYCPMRHKAEHHGKERLICIGPEGQEVLRPFLDRLSESFCFSPAESEAERNAARRAGRKSPMTPSQAARKRKGKSFANRNKKDSYCRAVARACELAFGFPEELRQARRIECKKERARLMKLAAEWRAEHVWSPNQLRHSRATLIREKFGLEAVACVLGHSDIKTSTIYAERNIETAASVMQQIG